MKRFLIFFSFFVIAAMITSMSFAGIDYSDPANNPTGQTWRPTDGHLPPPEVFPSEPPEDLPYGSGNEPEPGDSPTFVPFPQDPTAVDNPYGPPSVNGEPGWEWEWTEGWGNPGQGNDPAIITWHFEGVDPENPLEVTTLTFMIPNNPENNPFKEITWTMISDKAPKLGENGHFAAVSGGDSNGGTYGVSYPTDQPSPLQLGGDSSDDGVWYQYSGVIRIEPNPEFETISFDIYECTNIAEIEIKTVCVPVPEPGTLALLVSAGLGLALVVIRRRRG